jgi:hypothetical protein
MERSHLLLVLFLLLSVVTAEKWKTLPLHSMSILGIEAISENEVYASAVDSSKGPIVFYSSDKGQSWQEIKTQGNNLAMTVSKDRSVLCTAGTKSYCLPLAGTRRALLEKTEEDEKQQAGMEDAFSNSQIQDLQFANSYQTRDIQRLDDTGFAMVGWFRNPSADATTAVNGVAFTHSYEQSWKLSDIGLSVDDGYYASHGSFPSSNTWYVTSGSWPIQSSFVANVLSGKLNLILATGDLFGFQYELLSLKNINSASYTGAISKTTDGGKTWNKVYDSEKKFYFNQISCYDEDNCIAIGEGSSETLVLKTDNGGKDWNIVLKLSSDYSLHTCMMLSKSNLWVAGGMLVKDNLNQPKLRGSSSSSSSFVGIYYHSTNSGEKWDLSTLPGYVYDLTFFNEDIGYATTISQTSGGISKLISS